MVSPSLGLACLSLVVSARFARLCLWEGANPALLRVTSSSSPSPYFPSAAFAFDITMILRFRFCFFFHDNVFVFTFLFLFCSSIFLFIVFYITAVLFFTFCFFLILLLLLLYSDHPIPFRPSLVCMPPPRAPPMCALYNCPSVCMMYDSSCSPDFGVGGVSDRLGQISPKIVFFSLGYLYGGKWHDCRGLATEVLARLPGTVRYGTVHGRDGREDIKYWYYHSAFASSLRKPQHSSQPNSTYW